MTFFTHCIVEAEANQYFYTDNRLTDCTIWKVTFIMLNPQRIITKFAVSLSSGFSVLIFHVCFTVPALISRVSSITRKLENSWKQTIRCTFAKWRNTTPNEHKCICVCAVCQLLLNLFTNLIRWWYISVVFIPCCYALMWLKRWSNSLIVPSNHNMGLTPSVFVGTHEGSDVCCMAAGPGRGLPERTGRETVKCSPDLNVCFVVLSIV